MSRFHIRWHLLANMNFMMGSGVRCCVSIHRALKIRAVQGRAVEELHRSSVALLSFFCPLSLLIYLIYLLACSRSLVIRSPRIDLHRLPVC